nr:hypothetical protein [Vibrio splendidus]MCC4883086.1 hypothetical protein [Vibrio splendidus]
MSIITFEQRRAKIVTVEDLEHQIVLARKYFKRLKTEAKKCPGTLAEKLAINDKAKAAEQVCRELRMKSFDIEDEINAAKAA